jgi:pilus assembly protein Flp/PilA
MSLLIKRFVAEDQGSTSLEYALIATLISVFIIGAAYVMSSEIGLLFTQVETKMSNATTKA